MKTQAKQAKFVSYGGLIHAWRNEVKFTLGMVFQDTGITEESLQQDISNNIIGEITQVIPANTKLNKVDWEIE